MDVPLPFTDREAAFLRALLEEGVEFLVVGLAAAALQGAPAVTEDVDLWFADLSDPRLREALRRVGASYVEPSASNPPLFVGGGTELFDIVLHMHGLGEFTNEVENAVTIRLDDLELPVLSLDRIIASKRATNRPKDRAILPTLEETLRTVEHRSEED